MYDETPGHRIRAKRVQLGISQAKLGSLVGLTERAINSIEVGTMPTTMIDDSYLPRIAVELRMTMEQVLHGELRSEASTREELLRMREEGIICSDDELKRLDEFAMESIRQRNNANIPPSRVELVALLEVIRGADGF